MVPEEVAEDPENSNPIHANKIMNQKMDATTSQKSMSHPFIHVRAHRTDVRLPLIGEPSRGSS